jgi:asparagine synthase (glutamine-hydrolysing)
MCGIAGVVAAGDWNDTIAAMTRALLHRGPDDGGVWSAPGVFLGHRRLSILDLSPAGHQPMHFGPYTIVYNGEVYNFRELRKSLPGPFQSDSDTEVLLHLYAQHGPKCLDLLQGMFAFAIWDSSRSRLFAARDRLGIKPFYFHSGPDKFLFASEIKALLPAIDREVDRSALFDFFTYKYTPGEKTIYRHVRKLLPGHCLEYEAGSSPVIRRYWHPVSAPRIREPEAALATFEDTISRIVPEHTLADVPVGLFLSGGLDSTLLLSALDRPRTYTLDLAGSTRSEAADARRTAEFFGSHHTELRASAESVDEALDLLPQIYDEPFGDSAAWSMYLICREARREVTVALSGEGGDELFSGYKWYGKALAYRSSALARALARVLPPFSPAGRSSYRHAASGVEQFATFLGPFNPRQKRALLADDLVARDYDDLWYFRQHWRTDLDPLKRMQWVDMHTYLPDDLLLKADFSSMAVSLEVRPPLLDHRLAEFALSLDSTLLRDGSTGKLLMRRHLAKTVPDDILNRPKRGFSVPVQTWLERQPELARDAVRRLHRAGILRSPRPPRMHSEQLWSILMLDRWAVRAGLA